MKLLAVAVFATLILSAPRGIAQPSQQPQPAPTECARACRARFARCTQLCGARGEGCSRICRTRFASCQRACNADGGAPR